MGQFGPAPFGQRRGVEFVDVDAREIFARQRVVPFVHLVQRLHRVGVLVRPESIRCLVDAALQPDDQIVQARADIGIPLVGGPARLDVAGHKVGLGNQLPQGAAIHIGSACGATQAASNSELFMGGTPASAALRNVSRIFTAHKILRESVNL